MAGKAGGKSKKQGRNVKSGHNLRYKNERRAEKSHLRRITSHLKRFPDDKTATEALKAYKVKLGISPNA